MPKKTGPDGPPSHESGRFIETEDQDGRSVSIGEWVHRDDGYWALRLPINAEDLKPDRHGVRRVRKALAGLRQAAAERLRREGRFQTNED